jgi:hypothetical protein
MWRTNTELSGLGESQSRDICERIAKLRDLVQLVGERRLRTS